MNNKIKKWKCILIFFIIALCLLLIILKFTNFNNLLVFLNSNIGGTIITSSISLTGVLVTGLWGNFRLEKLKNIYSSKQKTYEIVKKFFDKINFEYVEYICTPTQYEMLSEQFEIFYINFEEQLELNFLLIPESIYAEFVETANSMDKYVEDNYNLGYFQKNNSGPEYAILEEKWQKSKKELDKQIKKLVNLVRNTYDIFNN